ncbi:hypothetical protein V5O48_000509 [Marasmius crinis-equi]|uniref:FAD/NAD(P)-binding domain-containing protein n=1 Tax=Marasmius crinis-equi TaxID=585013 RepID=A0ABR3G169_9AGAR
MSGQKTTIVVVGGGVAGTNIARPLSKSLDPALYEIILINPRPYSIILPPCIRMITSDKNDLKENVLVPFDRLFINDNGRFVQGEVVGIDANARELQLKSGETLGYDILVLGTGSKWDGPLAFPKEAAEVDTFIAHRRREFEEAKNILLIGGGAVGIGLFLSFFVFSKAVAKLKVSIELAGEIRDVWANKEITIIHRERLLLNDAYPNKVRIAAQKQLEGRNIKVVLDNTVSEDLVPGPSKDTPVPTKSGQTFRPDLIVRTWGARPDTEVVASSLGMNAVTPQGHIRVKPTLQLVDHPNIFAAGDIIDWQEQKTSAKASMGHAPVVVKNIINFVTGKGANAEYKGSTEILALTNGKDSGLLFVSLLWGILLGPFFAKQVKSRNLMVPMLRGALGY